MEYGTAVSVNYTTELFDSWFEGLRDQAGKSAIKVRRAEDGTRRL